MAKRSGFLGLAALCLLGLTGQALAALPEADAAFAAGLTAAKAGDLATAARHWEKALKLYRATPGDDRGVATCLLSLGAAYRGLDEPQRALEPLTQALQALRQLPDTSRQQAICLQNLALAHASLHQPQPALDYAQQALGLFAGLLGMAWEQARCLRTMAEAASVLGQAGKTVEWAQQGAALFEGLEGAERDRFACLLALGAAYGDLGQHQLEAQAGEQALDLARKLPDSAWEQAACLQNLGVAYGKLGDLERKLTLTEQALELFRTVPTAQLKQAECLQNLGTTHLELAQTSDALAVTRAALDQYRQLPGTEAQQAACLLNLGAIRGARGELAQELGAETDALAMLRRLPGTECRQAECLTNLGTTALALGKYEDGLARLQEAERGFRALARELGSAEAPWVPEALVVAEAGLGKAYALRSGPGDPERAYVRYAAAIRLLERLRTTAASAPEMRARYFGRLAWIYEDVIAALLRMRGTAAAPGQRLAEPQAELGGLWPDLHLPAADLWPGWGSCEEAMLHYSEASRARVLRDILAGDVAQGGGELQALHAAVARERDLADRLAAAAPATAGALRTELVEAGRQRLQAEMAWSRTALAQVAEPTPLRLKDVQGLLRAGETLVEYKLLPDKLLILVVTPDALRVVERPLHPGAGVTPGAAETRLRQRLQRLQAQAGEAAGLPPGTRLPVEPAALLQEFGVEELVWLYRQPMAALSSADERVRAQAQGEQAQQIRVAAALYELLLRPVEGLLPRQADRVPSLLVVPDGALYYLPFGALVARLPQDVEAAADGNVWAAPGVQYAVERWVISHLPSASMYAAMRKLAAGRPPPGRGLWAAGEAVFEGRGGDRPVAVSTGRGDSQAAGGPLPLPRLPGTRREAELALRAFAGPSGVLTERPRPGRWGPHVALLSRAATEAALKAPEVAQYGYLLLATHGVISPSAAALSYMALTASPGGAQDGRVYLMEILGLRLNARVVTLSGCRTGEGSFARGEGLLGLTAAFYAAGARAVTASLWTVADESTADLMGEYHRALARGRDPAPALREGQLSVLKAARAPAAGAAGLAHPYQWGAFVVMGR